MQAAQLGETTQATDERVAGTSRLRAFKIIEDFVSVIGAKRDLPIGLAEGPTAGLFLDERMHDRIHVGAATEVRAFEKHAVGLVGDAAQMGGVDA